MNRRELPHRAKHLRKLKAADFGRAMLLRSFCAPPSNSYTQSFFAAIACGRWLVARKSSAGASPSQVAFSLVKLGSKTFRSVGLSRNLYAVMIALFSLIFAQTGFPQAAPMPKRYALMVAVNKYEDAKLNSPQLEYPESDAKEIGQRLKEGGYDVEMLLGSEANAISIGKKLESMNDKGNADGAVVLGFFGHGVEYNGTDEAMYCPYDTTMRLAKDADGRQLFDPPEKGGSELLEPDPKSLIGMSAILRALKLCKAGNKLLLADCCRKSPNASRGRAFGSTVKFSDLPDRTAAIFACSTGEEAQEHPDWKHGAMSRSFLDLMPELANDATDINGITGRMAKRVANLVEVATEGRKKQTLNPIVKGIVELKLGKSKQVEPQLQELPAEFVNSIGMVFKLIPRGQFLMGSPESELDHSGKHSDDELRHRVSISRNFYMGVSEVTQEQFEKVMGFNPSHFRSGKASSLADGLDTTNHPVENVNWYDAVQFCIRLSEIESRTPAYKLIGIEKNEDNIQRAVSTLVGETNGYRLPTEAQWEYACRAGSQDTFSFGKAIAKSNANYDLSLDSGTTRDTSQSVANKFGLKDMHGNVWEWCWDKYDSDAYLRRGDLTKDPVVDEASEGSPRVLRGGSWSHAAIGCRSAIRYADGPENYDIDVGFRVVVAATLGTR